MFGSSSNDPRSQVRCAARAAVYFFLNMLPALLQVLKPGSGDEVKVADVIGSGKGLVVFMRHIG